MSGCRRLLLCFKEKYTIILSEMKTKEGKHTMNNIQYRCLKCGCTTYESDQFQATGGDFSKLFNVQNKRFCTISCVNCGYTELYRRETSAGMNVLDFLMNG